MFIGDCVGSVVFILSIAVYQCVNALAWEMSLLSNKMFGFNGCWKVGKQFTGESTLCNFDFQLVSVKPEISPWKYL